MKEIYKALKDCKIVLTISNNLDVNSIVKINDNIFDDVILAKSENNTRVLELDLKKDDIILVTDSELINYIIN
jgi:hypothetical protein